LSKKHRRSPLRILESVFLTGGLILLVSFFLLRGWGDYQAQSDIRAFEEAVAAGATATGTVATGSTSYFAEPDYALWSEKRIADYHEGNTIRDEAPLAIMSIDTLELKVPIYNGTDEINLNRGAGRIKGTAVRRGLIHRVTWVLPGIGMDFSGFLKMLNWVTALAC